MTPEERRLLAAAVAWWRHNRNRVIVPGSTLWTYYHEPHTRVLVEAAADVATADEPR